MGDDKLSIKEVFKMGVSLATGSGVETRALEAIENAGVSIAHKIKDNGAHRGAAETPNKKTLAPQNTPPDKKKPLFPDPKPIA